VGDEPKRDDNSSWSSLTRLLDVTLILTLLTGVIYFIGWLEAEEFFAYFGLTAAQAGLSHERILIAGFDIFYGRWVRLAIVLVVALLGYICVTAAADRWAWARGAVRSFTFNRVVGGLYTAVAVLLVGYFGLVYLGKAAEAAGKAGAEKSAREGSRGVFATYVRKDGKGVEEQKMLLWYGNGKYFLIDPPDSADSEARPAVTILGEDQVLSIRLVKVPKGAQN
jgi:hypothetical protein